MPDRPTQAPEVRAGDRDRERAIERLGQACGDGRLTLAELDERIEAAAAATTLAELDRLLADLPAPEGLAAPPAEGRDWVVGAFGSSERRGRWRLGPRTVAASVFGSTVVDLRDAVIDGNPVTMRAASVFGSVEVLVPPGVPVTVGGRGILGSVTRYGLSHDRPHPGVPHVHIDAVAVMGSVTVRRIRPPRRSLLRGRTR